MCRQRFYYPYIGISNNFQTCKKCFNYKSIGIIFDIVLGDIYRAFSLLITNKSEDMRNLIICLIFVLIQSHVSGQDLKNDSTISKNSFSVELGGAGLIGSLNYEHLIKKASNNKLLFRAGFSYIMPPIDDKHSFLLPFGLYYLIGIKHHIELGLNNTILWSQFPGATNGDNINIPKANCWDYFIMPSVGYRFENFNQKNIYFSIAYSPAIFPYFDKNNFKIDFNSWAKIGIGYSF